MINYKEIFILKHGQPDNEIALNTYINFIVSYDKDTTTGYSEFHHILPNCKFKEYSTHPDNLVRLLYDDHIHVHMLLFTAYNIRAYQRPLNWMMNSFKDTNMISNAAKKGWESLKQNTEVYATWKKSRSEYMKSLTSAEQRRRANIFWDNITEDRYLQFCKQISDIWTDKKKLEQSKKLKKFYENPFNREKKSIETKNRYESLSIKERNNFKEKMSNVNKRKDKRDNAGKTIKKLWQNDVFREKMKNRKVRAGRCIKLIFCDNTFKEFDSISSLSKTYSVPPNSIRRFIDIDKPIFLKQNKELAITGCYIKTIK
jgi:hypothetical protein